MQEIINLKDRRRTRANWLRAVHCRGEEDGDDDDDVVMKVTMIAFDDRDGSEVENDPTVVIIVIVNNNKWSLKGAIISILCDKWFPV